MLSYGKVVLMISKGEVLNIWKMLKTKFLHSIIRLLNVLTAYTKLKLINLNTFILC